MDCNIYDMPLFFGGDREVIGEALERYPGRHVTYDKGDIIAMQGYACRSIYLLCKGSVYARMVSDLKDSYFFQ